jgi:hypothetical protein
MKNKSTPLVDEHLKSLQGMQDIGTDDFFYTRLRARMEKYSAGNGWHFTFKPVWVVGTMAFLLIINVFILSQQSKSKQTTIPTNSSLQSFARSYDQAIPSY